MVYGLIRSARGQTKEASGGYGTNEVLKAIDYVANGQVLTCQTLMIEKVPVGPTRYRDVVLTSWDRGMSDRDPLEFQLRQITQTLGNLLH